QAGRVSPGQPASHYWEAQEHNMADTDFEVRQLLKAYRGGLISEELVTQQIDELIAAAAGNNGHASIPNVFAHRREGSKPLAKMLQQTPQSQVMVFTLPAGYTGDRENSHKGDQILYVIEGSAACRVSGQECTIKTG